MTDPESVPVARLTTPAQMVASVPLLLGFVPTESVVVLCCHEPRGRVGLTMRFDLPEPGQEPMLVQDIAVRVRHTGATRVVLAIYTSEPDRGSSHPRRAMVAALRRRFDDLVVTEVALVRAGRFWSYLCSKPTCCPREGQPVDEAVDTAAISLLHAERVLAGRTVLPSRAALEASLGGPTGAEAAAAMDRCEQALLLFASALEESGVTATREVSLAAWSQAAGRFTDPPAVVEDDVAAALAVSLFDVITRDLLVAWSVDHDAELRSLLEHLCTRIPAPYDAPVCTLFAWLTYGHGAGARAVIALERALTTDPTYSLALLLDSALQAQTPPEVVRVSATTAAEIQRLAG